MLGREPECAAIDRLLTPLLTDLPEHQAAALKSVLGLGEPQPDRDRFLVAAATLSLLAAAAEHQPLLCLIDDAQWLDSASADALLFAARRLGAEAVAMLFVVRDDGAPRRFRRRVFRKHWSKGSNPPPPRSYSLPPRPGAAEAARAWPLAEAAGNPLALLELPTGLPGPQLEGRTALPETAALSARLQAAFAHRVRGLPAVTRGALLIAALADGDKLSVVLRAAAATGLPDDCLDAGERAGMVRIVDGRLEFRHPLVRAVLRHTATVDEKRRAHAALAGVLDDGEHQDQSVWHRALASLAPDVDAADALDASAQRAQARGAHGAAATAGHWPARAIPASNSRPRSPTPARCPHFSTAAPSCTTASGYGAAASHARRAAICAQPPSCSGWSQSRLGCNARSANSGQPASVRAGATCRRSTN